MEPEALRALLERAGGQEPLRLAGEARAGELATFARDLLADEEEARPAEEAAAAGAPGQRRLQARLRVGRRRAAWRDCALLFAVFRAASLEQPREQRRLREILRDLRAQLPDAPTPAVVGVVLLQHPPRQPQAEAARLQLETLLRRVFRPGLPDTLQAVAYRPGDGRAAREAACQALRAALKLRADGAAPPKQKLPAFLPCIPWGRRSQDSHRDPKFSQDTLQGLEGAMALANIAPNGNCGEASDATDT
ncbi:uncharacterized protein C2orf72 homolog [Erythrolamprus reginae]|uniref:uncharacterized protein C2orf72 homolog n=1 Tax=Erythrolamprus reginae TaxID=121349 RepID=UPI00396C444B